MGYFEQLGYLNTWNVELQLEIPFTFSIYFKFKYMEC